MVQMNLHYLDHPRPDDITLAYIKDRWEHDGWTYRRQYGYILGTHPSHHTTDIIKDNDLQRAVRDAKRWAQQHWPEQ